MCFHELGIRQTYPTGWEAAFSVWLSKAREASSSQRFGALLVGQLLVLTEHALASIQGATISKESCDVAFLAGIQGANYSHTHTLDDLTEKQKILGAKDELDKWMKFGVWADNDFSSYDQLPNDANVLDSTLVEKVKTRGSKVETKDTAPANVSPDQRVRQEGQLY